MKGTLSNIDELEKHLSNKFKGMLKSKEMKQAGKEAGQAVGRHVGDSVVDGGKSGYDYNQSGSFHKLIREESKHAEVHQRQGKLTIGVFELDNMNIGVDARRNYQTQKHVVGMSGSRVSKVYTFKLKGEEQMPKWILAEFGTGRYSSEVPSQFKINYTRRNKQYMYGPSLGSVDGEGGGSKSGFFMISGSRLMNLLGKRAENRRNFRVHQGIKAGHMFKSGLVNSQEEVMEILGHGIQSYLDKG